MVRHTESSEKSSLQTVLGKGQALSKSTWQVIGWSHLSITIHPSRADFNQTAQRTIWHSRRVLLEEPAVNQTLAEASCHQRCSLLFFQWITFSGSDITKCKSSVDSFEALSLDLLLSLTCFFFFLFNSWSDHIGTRGWSCGGFPDLDLTENKRPHRALEQSESYHRRLFQWTVSFFHSKW